MSASIEHIDPMLPVLPNHPDVWDLDPRAKRLITVGGIYTRSQMNVLAEIVSNRWFLIRNQAGDRWGNRPKCRHCGKKHEYLTVQCVEGCLGEFPFTAVLGQRDDVAKKPDSAGAHEAARLMGCETSEILYVGDTAVDMQTARAAGMFALGVTWGFRPESELLENGAEAIIDCPLAVLDFL